MVPDHRFVTSCLKPVGKRKQTVYDVIAHGTGWNAVMGYTDKMGQEHTVYKTMDNSFCFDVRHEDDTRQGDCSYDGFPNMGESQTLYGLFNVVTERYAQSLQRH